MAITHQFVSGIADSEDTTIVRPIDWNAGHVGEHTHDNKSLLDTYTQTEANLADAVTKKHTANADTDLDATFEATFEKVANKGAISGYASLDDTTKVPVSQLGTGTPTGSLFLRDDRSWQSPGGGGESELILRTTGDVTNATTTFANITGLTFTALASKDYIIEAWVIFQSNTAGTGMKVALNGPASPTAVVLLATIPTVLTLYASDATLASRAYQTGTPSVSVDTINANLLCKVNALVRNGTNEGTLALQFAAETTGIVKIMTGSVLRYRQTN